MPEGMRSMDYKRAFGLVLIVAGIAFSVVSTIHGQMQGGDWTIHRSDIPGKVEFSLMDSRAGRHFHYSSDWPANEFSGLDFAKAGRQEVHFTIARDAGKLECEGYLNNGEGAGLFHFVADAKYPQEMKSLGFEGIDADKQLAMAIHDVSLKFAREIKSKNLHGLDTDKLIAFKIHGVTPEFIEGIRAAGLNASDSDKLIAFRIHGVSPAFVSEIRAAGLNLSDSDKFIAFRIHGVSPELIGQLQKLGYSHPAPDQLVAMRIHGVTPDFITHLQSRGMKNLTIDQLVSLRIHGID